MRVSGVLYLGVKIVLSISARIPLLRGLAMLIVRYVDIFPIVFLLTFADMIVGILTISKLI